MEKNIQMNILNESGTYDILYPQTTSSQVIGMPTSLPANGGNANTVGGQTPQQIINSALNQGLKIAMGSYVGTGVAGPDNPNSLTFSFSPKFVIINGRGYNMNPTVVFVNPCTRLTDGSVSYPNVSIDNIIWSGNSVSWYCNYSSDDPGYQLNEARQTYYYCAIG